MRDEVEEAVILRPSGEMDLGSVSAFREALTTAGSQGLPIIVDLSRIEYIDSCGIHALFDQANACKRRGEILMLVAPGGTIRRVIEIMNLDHAVTVLASVEAALDLVRSRVTPDSTLVQANARKSLRSLPEVAR